MKSASIKTTRRHQTKSLHGVVSPHKWHGPGCTSSQNGASRAHWQLPTGDGSCMQDAGGRFRADRHTAIASQPLQAGMHSAQRNRGAECSSALLALPCASREFKPCAAGRGMQGWLRGPYVDYSSNFQEHWEPQRPNMQGWERAQERWGAHLDTRDRARKALQDVPTDAVRETQATGGPSPRSQDESAGLYLSFEFVP